MWNTTLYNGPHPACKQQSSTAPMKENAWVWSRRGLRGTFEAWGHKLGRSWPKVAALKVACSTLLAGELAPAHTKAEHWWSWLWQTSRRQNMSGLRKLSGNGQHLISKHWKEQWTTKQSLCRCTVRYSCAHPATQRSNNEHNFVFGISLCHSYLAMSYPIGSNTIRTLQPTP